MGSSYVSSHKIDQVVQNLFNSDNDKSGLSSDNVLAELNKLSVIAKSGTALEKEQAVDIL